MKLADLTAGYVEKVDASTPLAEAARWMVSRGVGSLLITREGRVKGIFTEHDLTRAAAHRVDLDEAPAGDRMSDDPRVATPDWTIERAADVVVEADIRHLPLVDDDGNIAGIVSIKDVLWALRGPTVT